MNLTKQQREDLVDGSLEGYEVHDAYHHFDTDTNCQQMLCIFRQKGTEQWLAFQWLKSPWESFFDEGPIVPCELVTKTVIKPKRADGKKWSDLPAVNW